jgi:hypothetical protein
MQEVYLEQFDAFHCVGGACPYTCCAYWRIDIDEETAEFYRGCAGEFGEYLNRWVVKDGEHTRMELINGHCALLNEEGLCRIQLAYGEKALSHTCQSFPRGNHIFGRATLCSMSLACPETVRQLFEWKRPIKLLSRELGALPQLEKPMDNARFELGMQALHTAARWIQNREYSVAQRELALLQISRIARDALSEGEPARGKRELRAYDGPGSVSTTSSLAAHIQVLRELGELILKTDGVEIKNLFATAVTYILSEKADLTAASAYLREFGEGKLARERENLLLELLLKHYLSSYAACDLYRQAIYIVFYEQLYRGLAAVFSAQRGEVLPQEERILLVVYLSRYFEHASEAFLNQLDRLLEQKHLSDEDFLLRLLS